LAYGTYSGNVCKPQFAKLLVASILPMINAYIHNLLEVYTTYIIDICEINSRKLLENDSSNIKYLLVVGAYVFLITMTQTILIHCEIIYENTLWHV
jgi:hypothetical protein